MGDDPIEHAGQIRPGELRLEWRDPADLPANGRNWRRHPPAQAKAMKDAVAEVGWAGALLYNDRTGRLIDGHLRKELFSGGSVPVLVGDWSEEQEKKILLTLDPLSTMALPDIEPQYVALILERLTGIGLVPRLAGHA